MKKRPIENSKGRELMDTLKLAQLRSRRIERTYEVPSEYLDNNTRTAYDSGYEIGWRGWGYDNPYTSNRHRIAYLRGYSAAAQAIIEEVSRRPDMEFCVGSTDVVCAVCG